MNISDRKDLENRLDWLEKRIGMSTTDRGYISLQMVEFAKKKAADSLKGFCAYVMHEDSDLHKDAQDWIDNGFKE